MLKRQEAILWVGDGFNCARDQIGRRVNIDGKKGKVIDASGLYIIAGALLYFVSARLI